MMNAERGSVKERQPALSSRCRVQRSSFLVRCLLFVLASAGVLSLVITESSAGVTETMAARDTQHQPHQWGAITLFHGLPSERVRAIAQDRDGALWFGTDAGLARYDGRRTQALPAAELPASSVRSLSVDSGGVLWVGTATGAARRIGGAFRVIEETRGCDVTAITHAGDGRTLIACAGAILECRAESGGELKVTQLARLSKGDDAAEGMRDADGDSLAGERVRAEPEITGISLGTGGALFAGTRGRGVLSVEGGAMDEFAFRPRAYFVEAMASAAEGAIWLGVQTSQTGEGLYKISTGGDGRSRVERAHLPTGTVRALRVDDAGDLWIGTAARGVFRRRGDGQTERWTFEGTAGGLLSDAVNAIFLDREGVVWFGTDRGVCRYDSGAMRGEIIAADHDANFVRVFYTTATGVVLCGASRGLFRRDAAGGWQPVADLAGETVHAIGEDMSGRLLVGTSRGLFVEEFTARDATGYLRFALDTSDAGDPDRRSVRAITRFRGKIYLGIYGAGVVRFDGATRTPIGVAAGNSDDAAREVTSLYADGDSRLWVGTARVGVWRVDGSEGGASALILTPEPTLAGLSGRALWDIEERDGAMWFATSSGLYRFRDGELKVVIEETDVRGVYISEAASRAGEGVSQGEEVWCATNGDGLLVVRMVGDSVITSRFGAEHGLPSQNVFAVMNLNERGATHRSLLTGTSRGAARYIPSSVAPLVRIARVGNQIIGDRDEVPAVFNLAYPQNDLALDISAVSTRTFPEQFRYRFRLRNNRGEVIATRFARDAHFAFENLAPGRYEVEAQAYSADLLASTPVRLAVEVETAPFPWTSAWLSLLLALTLAALLWGAVQNRRILRTSLSLAEANRELAAARLALATEAEAERRRIARDLHDQTLADLRRLMLRADESEEASSSGTQAGDSARALLDPAALRREVETISTEVRRICEDLSPSVLENVGFAAALEWALVSAVEQLPVAAKFNYRFLCDEDFELGLRLKRSSQIQIYRIVQEALNNIGRHAAATNVLLTARLVDDESLLLQLEDDGRGFDLDAARARKGRGLTGIRARALLIGAEVAWMPRAEGGTIFTVRVVNKL